MEQMHPELKRALNMPSIKQRTPEWYEARQNLITASSCADALGENPYDKMARRHLLEQKTSPLVTQRGGNNIYMIHGTYFEPVATKLYEEIFGDRVYETGLIRHPDIEFIGASPDGLCADGRMLEIKCPLKRKIKKSGQIKGAICPTHYWMQIQVQLEVCDLQRCDFWQCSFQEFSTFEEWQAWKPAEHMLLISRQPQPSEWQGVRKGMYILLNDTTAIYPEQLFRDEDSWVNWVITELDKVKGMLNRVVYWRLDDCFNQPIYRDTEWFRHEALPKLTVFWQEVEEARRSGKSTRSSFYSDI